MSNFIVSALVLVGMLSLIPVKQDGERITGQIAAGVLIVTLILTLLKG